MARATEPKRTTPSMGWFADRRIKRSKRQACLALCAYYYAVERDRAEAQKFLIATAILYQTLVGNRPRRTPLDAVLAELEREFESTQGDGAAFSLGKITALTQDIRSLNTGVRACLKSKSLLETLSPELMGAIEAGDPNAIVAVRNKGRTAPDAVPAALLRFDVETRRDRC